MESSLVAVYMYNTITVMDAVQDRFIAYFAELMSDDEHVLEPMSLSRKRRGLRIHVVLMIVTFGIYSQFFLLWTIHNYNRHIREQWSYEKKVLQWISLRSGGLRVEKVRTDNRSGTVNLIKRMI